MANTFELISSTVVGAGGASTIDFTSIPSTYTDLVIKVSGRINVAAIDAHIALRFNNDSSGIYSMRLLRGNGAAASSYSESSATEINLYGSIDGNSTTSNTFSNTEIYIPNYAGSANKSISVDAVQENNATTAWANFFAGLWGSTSAINRVTLTGSANFMQYSTAYLYGVKNA